MLYRDEGSKYILVFNKQQENHKPSQYVQQNACSFVPDLGYFWRFLGSFCYIFFSEPIHENLRTEIQPGDWNVKASKLPFCVGSICTGISDDTSALITGLDNKQILWEAPAPECQTAI